MSCPAKMNERHQAVLGELAELGMALARRLHRQALGADDDEAEGLARAFHLVSRSVRLTLSLEAQLERHARSFAAQDRGHEAGEAVIRRAQARIALEREIRAESEGEACEDLLDELNARLVEAAVDDELSAAPVETLIGRLRADLRLAGNVVRLDSRSGPSRGPPGPPG